MFYYVSLCIPLKLNYHRGQYLQKIYTHKGRCGSVRAATDPVIVGGGGIKGQSQVTLWRAQTSQNWADKTDRQHQFWHTFAKNWQRDRQNSLNFVKTVSKLTLFKVFRPLVLSFYMFLIINWLKSRSVWTKFGLQELIQTLYSRLAGFHIFCCNVSW